MCPRVTGTLTPRPLPLGEGARGTSSIHPTARPHAVGRRFSNSRLGSPSHRHHRPAGIRLRHKQQGAYASAHELRPSCGVAAIAVPACEPALLLPAGPCPRGIASSVRQDVAVAWRAYTMPHCGSVAFADQESPRPEPHQAHGLCCESLLLSVAAVMLQHRSATLNSSAS